MSDSAHSRPTKLLHSALLLAVLWQLFAMDWAERPRNGAPGNLLFVIHEIVGLTTLALVVVFWLWSALRRDETPLGGLLPWVSAAPRRAVVEDIRVHLRHLRARRLPAIGASTPLASATHGLGLLVVLAMGMSGVWLYTQDEPGGLILEVHRALSNLMWAYVIGHAGIAVLHQFMEHRILQRMFGRNASVLPPD